MELTYLDWAATAPISKKAREAVNFAMEHFQGNPSSIHREGKRAQTLLHEDRATCARLLDVDLKTIYFTSGGTESNSIIMHSMLKKRASGTILVSGIEHPSIFGFINSLVKAGWNTDIVQPDSRGIVQPEKVREKLSPDTAMVVIMLVNNETGIIQPVGEITKVIRQYERITGKPVHVHSDGVQALGKIPFSIRELDIDSAAFSSHKIQGPRGAGILYAKKTPLIFSNGGGQESGVRPGTENVAAIHGLTTAMEEYLTNKSFYEHVKAIKSILIKELSLIPEIELLADTKNQSPFITAATVKHFPGEAFTRIMSDRGFAISSGSACSSRNKKKRARVLNAMGVSGEKALHAFRISIGPQTSSRDIREFCKTVNSELQPFRRK